MLRSLMILQHKLSVIILQQETPQTGTVHGTPRHPEHKMLILCPALLGISVQTASLLGGEGQAAGQVQSLRCVASDLQRASVPRTDSRSQMQ